MSQFFFSTTRPFDKSQGDTSNIKWSPNATPATPAFAAPQATIR